MELKSGNHLQCLTIIFHTLGDKRKKPIYSVTSICLSPRELRTYFELSEVLDKQIVTSPIYSYKLSTLVESAFLQCTCTFQYGSTCAHSHSVSTENGIGIKTLEKSVDFISILKVKHFNKQQNKLIQSTRTRTYICREATTCIKHADRNSTLPCNTVSV